MRRTPKRGESAREFELPTSDGSTYSLAGFRGRPLVVAFYPRDRGGVCTRQLTSYAAAWPDITATGASLVAISSQDMESHRRFAADRGFPFPLLADPDGRVIAAWGLEGPFGLARRASFVVDGGGIVRHAFVSRTGATYHTGADLAGRLATLASVAGKLGP